MANPIISLFFPHPHNNHKAKIFHPHALLVLIGIFLMGRAFIDIYSAVRPGVLGFASQIDPNKIISLTNDTRKSQGLEPLQYNAKLSEAARAKVSDMFQHNYWAHVSPQGVEPWYFITNSGYQYQHAGENLARDFADANSIVNAWIASPTHKKNLLDPRFKDIGIAVMDGYINGVETTIVVQMFGAVQKAGLLESAQTFVPQPAVLAIENKLYPSTGITPLAARRSWSLAFVIIVVFSLAIDWMFVWRNNIIRISGKTWAHLTYFVTLALIIIIVRQGLIL